MEDFIIRAFIAAIGIAIISGSIGCFVIWKKISYFSDALSHSAILGITVGLATGVGVNIGIIIMGACFSVLMIILKQRNLLSNDTILGILSPLSLSLGVVLIAFFDFAAVDYFSILFGDILTVSLTDIIIIYVSGIIIIALLIWLYQPLLLLTLNEDLARAENVNNIFYEFIFMLMIALMIANSVQIVGILLTTSLLIIPAAIAKNFANSPKKMIYISIIFAIISVIFGLGISIEYDIASGPAIVLALGALFIISYIFSYKRFS